MANFKTGRAADKASLRRGAAWAALVGLASVGAAHAQEAAEPAADEDEVIVVTGTRLPTNEFNSPDPIQVITTESGQLSGVADIAELLQSSTIASGSPQVDATISSAFVTEGGPGAQTVSLRGLGASRTLVLLNGRRAGPAGSRGQISSFDLNVVPFSSVERFEILKDGASSIYGSDAVAGVVNIITNQEINGGHIDISAVQPFEEGGEEFSAEAVWGITSQRGYFNVAVDYYKQNELTNGQRSYTDCREDYTFDMTTGERNDRIDPRTGRPACLNVPSGQIWLYEFVDDGPWNDTDGPLNSGNGEVLFQWDPSGQLGTLLPQTIVPVNPDPTNAAGWPTVPVGVFAVGYDNATQGVINSNPESLRNASLQPEIERTNLFFQGGWEINNQVEAYGEVLLNRRRTKVNGFRQFWTFQYTGDVGDPVNTEWGGVAILSPTAVTDHNDSEQVVDYGRVVAGLRGDFAGWLGQIHWDIYAQASHSYAEYTDDQILAEAVNSQRYRTALCAGTVLPVSQRPCLDINWNTEAFLNGRQTAEERAFLFDTETGTTTYDQLYVEGILAGDIFQLPAGNVGAALGVHVRREEIIDSPGPLTQAGIAWNSSTAGVTAGDDLTSEIFGEMRVPLVRDAAFAREISLSLSGRYTDVESYGSDSTYKLGFNWALTDEWRFRATKGTSFRAPALFEQFLNDQTGFLDQRQVDPCINWAAALAAGNIPQRVADNCDAAGVPDDLSGAGSGVTVTSGGGSGLEAETSDAWTIGAIWQPSFADLSIAIDYFEIEVNNEVTQLGANNIVYGCYNSDNFPNDPLCALFNRNAAGSTEEFLIESVTDDFLNIANQVNRGVDFTVRYRRELGGIGDFVMQLQATKQLEDTQQLVQGIEEDYNGDNGDPEWVAGLDLMLERDDWTFFWGIDYIGETTDANDYAADDTINTRYKLDMEAIVYHDASVRRRFDTWELTLGVANVFDQEPPIITSQRITGASSDAGNSILSSQYDYIGRRAFLRIGKTF